MMHVREHASQSSAVQAPDEDADNEAVRFMRVQATLLFSCLSSFLLELLALSTAQR
jgi:hypothetical protein